MRRASATASAMLKPSPGAGSEAHANCDGLGSDVFCPHPLDAWPGRLVGISSAHAAVGPATATPQPVGKVKLRDEVDWLHPPSNRLTAMMPAITRLPKSPALLTQVEPGRDVSLVEAKPRFHLLDDSIRPQCAYG